MEKTVIELFAGVGGFRVGLNEIEGFDENGRAIENDNFTFVWANQWEPSTKTQHAYDCYNLRFPNDNNSNSDISLVNKNDIPNHSLLCGGFPCQDYSVAHSLSKEKGIEGKKGVLWWQIRDILIAKQTPFVFLENVDRLTKSPAKQRGRDFGIMLRCLSDLGYAVEWRIINAAEYGMPQRRRRTYILAYKNTTRFYNELAIHSPRDVFNEFGIFARQFEINPVETINEVDIVKGYNDVVDVSNKFKYEFLNAGFMINGKIYTTKVEAVAVNPVTLNNIVENNVDESYYLTEEQKEKFAYLRGSKKITRIAPDGSTYYYSEGAMSEYDELDLPGRTMLTSEGSINRSTHIIRDNTERIRILTPVECERLNQFPDNWTNSGMPEKRRYFMMGNALVCGIVRRIGRELQIIIENEE